MSNEELLVQAKAYYNENPEIFEELYRKVKEEKGIEQQQQNEASSKSFTSQQEGSFSKEIAEEMTLLRLDPPAYVAYIEQHQQSFQDEFTYRRENENILIKTNEGKKAVEECISVLKAQTPLCAVIPSELLEKASLDHQRDTSANNIQGHTGSDQSTPQQRVERHGVWRGKIGENVDYGNKVARDIIVALLVDDGVENRGHRMNLLNPDFEMVGSAIGSHAMYGVCCVMNFATSIKSKEDIITEDSVATCKGTAITEEIMKILESMPIDKDQQVNMINEKLAAGMELTLSFKPSLKSAEFVFTKDGGMVTQNLSWGTQ